MAVVRDGHASDQIVVRRQEVLRVRVGEVARHNGGACDADEVLAVRVQEHRVVNLAAESDGVVKLDERSIVGDSLSVDPGALAVGRALCLGKLLLWKLLLHD